MNSKAIIAIAALAAAVSGVARADEADASQFAHKFETNRLRAEVQAEAVTVARTWHRTEAREDKVQAVLLWYGLAAATLAASWAFYFHFFTLGFAADDLARRLVLTLGWLAAGVGLVMYGRLRGESVIRDAGFAFIAVALGKALAYDTTHLSGTLRVACFAGAGALMLGGAWLSSPRTARSA